MMGVWRMTTLGLAWVVVVVDADEGDVGVNEYIDTDISRGMVEVGCRFEGTKVNNRPSL